MKPAFKQKYLSIEETHWWFRARKRIFSVLLSGVLKKDANRRILDLGSGGGSLARTFSRFGIAFALDAEAGGLKQAREKGISRLVQADAATLPFRSRVFHLVCAMDLLEHLEDDGFAISEAHRVLQEEGLFLISVPAFSFLWSRQDVVNNHYRRYTLNRLKKQLEKAGFSIERGTYFNTFLFPIVAIYRLLGRPFLGKISDQEASDFDLSAGRFGNAVLFRLFSLEAHLLKRVFFPFGVSVLVLCKKKKDKTQ